VEAVTLLHQYQRSKKTVTYEGEELHFIIATPADYRIAYELATDVLHATFHELTRSARDLWSVILALAKKSGEKPAHFEFLRRELRQFSSWQDHRLRDALAELVEMEYLAAVGGSQGKAYTYRLLVHGEEGPSLLGDLTTPDELERKLGQVHQVA
jgi:hypothetical protein